MPRALLAGALAAVLVAAVGIGAGVYAAMNKTVTLVVDGQVSEVGTFGATVGDVLAQETIEVDERDVVAPDPSTEVREGTRIAVRYGRELQLSVDGTESTYWVTATSVGEALDQLGLRYRDAKLSSSRSTGIERKGLDVDVVTNKQLTIVHDGEKTPVATTATTVADALAAADISLANDDKVEPSASTPLEDGATITVTRIRTEKELVEVELPFESVREPDSELFEDEEEVEQDGRAGLEVETRRVTYVDGKKTKSKLLSTEVVREPVDRVVRYGTRERPEPTTLAADDGEGEGSEEDSGGGDVGGEADGLNWAALAECESGGDPRAVNPAGYYGLYQFSLSTWQSVGGSGNPADASPEEQTYRAKLLYNKAGAGQWPNCGRYLYS